MERQWYVRFENVGRLPAAIRTSGHQPCCFVIASCLPSFSCFCNNIRVLFCPTSSTTCSKHHDYWTCKLRRWMFAGEWTRAVQNVFGKSSTPELSVAMTSQLTQKQSNYFFFFWLIRCFADKEWTFWNHTRTRSSWSSVCLSCFAVRWSERVRKRW